MVAFSSSASDGEKFYKFDLSRRGKNLPPPPPPFLRSFSHSIYPPWLPDGYGQISSLYVVGLSGLKDYGSATLRCKIESLPFLGLRPPQSTLQPDTIQ